MTAAEDWCLGLEILGRCVYDPSNVSWHLISLGDSLAAIALIVTFSQLLTPVLKARVNQFFPRVYVLCGLAVFSIVVASVLPFIPGHALPLLGYPVFWEAIGASLIIYGIFLLIWKFNCKLKFKKGTVRDITRLCYRIIATGEQKDHAELVHCLGPVIKDLVTAIKPYDTFEKERSLREGKEYSPPALSLEAGQILRVCSDETFCSTVVRKEPGFAIELFREIKSQKAYENNFAKPLVWEIVRQSILNTDSILYRERRYSGLGYTSGFTNSAFCDGEFNESVTPLGGFSPILEKNLPIEAANRFGDILQLLAKAYLEDKKYYEHSYSIHNGFRTLLDWGQNAAYRIDYCEPDQLIHSYSFEVLSAVGHTLTKLIKVFEEDANIVNDEIVGLWSKSEKNRDYSPFEYMATAMYELFEALSHTRRYDSQLRSILIGPWLQLYPVTEETVFHKEVQRRFEEKLFEQLKVNLEEGYYPAVTRPLITLIGLNQNQRKGGEERLRTNFLNYLAEKFPVLYERDPEAALDKLPVNVAYDAKERKLVQRVRKGDERTLTCAVTSPTS